MQLQRQSIRVVEESHLLAGVIIHADWLAFNPDLCQLIHLSLIHISTMYCLDCVQPESSPAWSENTKVPIRIQYSLYKKCIRQWNQLRNHCRMHFLNLRISLKKFHALIQNDQRHKYKICIPCIRQSVYHSIRCLSLIHISWSQLFRPLPLQPLIQTDVLQVPDVYGIQGSLVPLVCS